MALVPEVQASTTAKTLAEPTVLVRASQCPMLTDLFLDESFPALVIAAPPYGKLCRLSPVDPWSHCREPLGMDREFKQMQRALAANLLRLRAAKSLTQEQLALEAEVDRTYVSEIERCLKNPLLLILHQLAKALNSNVVSLLQT